MNNAIIKIILLGIILGLSSINSFAQVEDSKDSFYFYSHINDVDYDSELIAIPVTSKFQYLRGFVQQIKWILEHHHWDLLLKQCDAKHVTIQNTNFLKSDPLYLAGILELDFTNNALECENEQTDYNCLNQIARFEIVGIPKEELNNSERFSFFGFIHLKNKKVLRTALTVLKRDGVFKITGSVG